MTKSKRKKKIKDSKYLTGLTTLIVLAVAWFFGFLCGFLYGSM